jgi:hypothetical protein
MTCDVSRAGSFIFITWDRLFGTFEAVGPEHPCNPYVPPLNKERIKTVRHERVADTAADERQSVGDHAQPAAQPPLQSVHG